ncbi:chemotaxis protein CheW [Trinickia fusca]|uniref:Purine-binding chemotaxis protein CheW n=1 Tax=Trinickia fusca TaxID=2419777 RepID=A0A494XDB3_9BURK|nr:chemotaxis protein CheW [Trinickia fusca]RKP46456.1 purine-binding chemotaxis protein CheW [Trinickia fusca]
MKRTERRGAIDWADARHRLDSVEQALADHAALPPDTLKAILEARARSLAAEPPLPRGNGVEILAFKLAQEHYAIETTWVREVLVLRDLVPMPSTPAFVLGVVNVRGKIISVLDIKTFFELPEKGLTDLNRVILLSDGAMEFGLLADVIEGVRFIEADDLQPPLPTLTGIRAEYLMGITRQRQVVLDGRKLLADPAIVVIGE